MPTRDIVSILIEAKNAVGNAVKDAKKEFQGLGSGLKGTFSSISSGFNTLKKHWLAVTATMTGAFLLFKKGMDIAEEATKFRQSMDAYRSIVAKLGRDATEEFEKIREASAGLVDKQSIVEATNRALSLGIPIDKLAELMEIARAKAKDMSITTTQAFNDIATGIGRGSPLIIDNLGIVLKLGEANKRLAEELGITVEQMDDKQKKLAILNEVLKAGAEAVDRYKDAIKTDNENLEEMKAKLKDVNLELGEKMIPILMFWSTLKLALADAVVGLTDFGQTWGDVFAQMSIDVKDIIDKEKFLADYKKLREGFVELEKQGKTALNAILESGFEQIEEDAKKTKDLMEKFEKDIKDKLLDMLRSPAEKVIAQRDKLLETYASIPEAVALINRAFGRRIVEEAQKTLNELKRMNEEAERLVAGLSKGQELPRETIIRGMDRPDIIGGETRFGEVAPPVTEGQAIFSAIMKGARSATPQIQSELKQWEMFAEDTATNMSNAFSDGFFRIMRGEFESLSDVLDNLLRSIQRQIADILSQLAMNALMSQMAGLFPTATPTANVPTAQPASPTGGTTMVHRGGLVLHHGGLVPKLHQGGLAPDERRVILQTRERVLSRDQNVKFERMQTQLDNISSGGMGGGNTVNVYAMDSEDVGRFVKKHQDIFAGGIMGASSDNHPIRRGG